MNCKIFAINLSSTKIFSLQFYDPTNAIHVIGYKMIFVSLYFFVALELLLFCFMFYFFIFFPFWVFFWKSWM